MSTKLIQPWRLLLYSTPTKKYINSRNQQYEATTKKRHNNMKSSALTLNFSKCSDVRSSDFLCNPWAEENGLKSQSNWWCRIDDTNIHTHTHTYIHTTITGAKTERSYAMKLTPSSHGHRVSNLVSLRNMHWHHEPDDEKRAQGDEDPRWGPHGWLLPFPRCDRWKANFSSYETQNPWKNNVPMITLVMNLLKFDWSMDQSESKSPNPKWLKP